MSNRGGATSSTAIVPRPRVDEISGWDELDRTEQQKVRREADLLAQAIFEQGRSRLEIGRHLHELNSMLRRTHERVWMQLLEAMNIPTTTAYRYMKAYRNASKLLPENILMALMAVGVEFARPTPSRPLGKLTEIVESHPPPKTSDPKKVEAYVAHVAKLTKRRKGKPKVIEGHVSPDEVLKDAYRYVVLRLQGVPPGKRLDWLTRLTGYLLGDIGVDDTIRAKALPLPEGYKAVPGRPRLDRKPN